MSKYKRGETVIYLDELYEFGYYTETGCVIYVQGERNMQDSYAVKLDDIKRPSKKDLKNLNWG